LRETDWTQLRGALCAWFERNARDLPWRKRPTAYRVWVSEIMLQQTRVEAVTGPWARFMKRFPTLKALAAAPLEDVLEAWSGLGYYRRARLMHQAAQSVQRLPRTVDDLRALPGIGRYTAGAIVSLACNRPAAIVDGNIERVFARWLAIDDNIKSAPAQRRVWQQADDWVTRGHAEGHAPRALNQALMELGATVCTPKSPRCGTCPAAGFCAARKAGQPERWPVLPPRKSPTAVRYNAYAVRDARGRVLMRRRPEDDRSSLLPAGLWELPHADEGAAQRGVTAADSAPLGSVRHAIMEYSLTLTLLPGNLHGRKPAGARWFEPAEADTAAISSATRKLLALLNKSEEAGKGRA
jgi:A/G-specific adenine glycosylase